jgi:hypothetical protein
MPIVPRDTDAVPVKECAHWIGAEQRHCRAIEGVRPYITGLRGLPEVPPGPGIPAYRKTGGDQ